MNYESAMALLRRYNSEPFHLTHAITVAKVMRRMAAELGSCELPAAREVFERIALLDRRCRQDAAQAARCRREMLWWRDL